MKIEKKILTDMDRCYCVACMDINGKPHAAFATEGKGGFCAYDLETLQKRIDIWHEPGGTMSIVQIPDKPGEFLAGQKFFRLFDWEEAGMAWVKHQPDGSFSVKPVLQIPYLHRFDILTRNGKQYFIGCSLAAHKATREDWSHPGSVYVGAMPDSRDTPFTLEVLRDDFYQNHGYERVSWNGTEAAMVSCKNGIFIVTPPETADAGWTVEQIMTQPTSDTAIIDLDGDGEPEIAAIEEFHGRYFRVYKRINGTYQKIFEHPEVTEFYHVAASGTVCGKPVFIGGCRRGKQQLFLLQWNHQSGTIDIVTIDEPVGPSNAMLTHYKGKDYLISANRETAQAAIYCITE